MNQSLIQSASIVVCTYNRLDYLKKCLTSLLELKFLDYEIIIVNDASSDGTSAWLNNLNNPKIKIIHHQVNQGPSLARNSGAQIAQNEIVAFIDDDCLADKNWLKELLAGFNDEKVGLVIGSTFYVSQNYKGYFPERLINNQNAKWPGAGNIAYRQTVFKTCGGFDNYFFQYNNEDSEMAIRALSYEFLFKRATSAIVYHQPAKWTTKSLLRSAKNASVWPILKKRYPKYYLIFGPPIKFNFIINPLDYILLITAPISIPLLFIRYLLNGQGDVKIFFTRWPVYLILRRYYIYKEALRQGIFMI